MHDWTTDLSHLALSPPRTLALVALRQRHPDDSSDQRRRRLADLVLGQELATRVYDPLLERV